jgi:hypothetical protein
MPSALITLYNSLNFPESIAIRHRDPSQDKITSNRESTNTSSNSSYSASNGSEKKPNHSTFNSFPLSNFHHQFLESNAFCGRLQCIPMVRSARSDISGSSVPNVLSVQTIQCPFL